MRSQKKVAVGTQSFSPVLGEHSICHHFLSLWWEDYPWRYFGYEDQVL